MLRVLRAGFYLMGAVGVCRVMWKYGAMAWEIDPLVAIIVAASLSYSIIMLLSEAFGWEG